MLWQAVVMTTVVMAVCQQLQPTRAVQHRSAAVHQVDMWQWVRYRRWLIAVLPLDNCVETSAPTAKCRVCCFVLARSGHQHSTALNSIAVCCCSLITSPRQLYLFLSAVVCFFVKKMMQQAVEPSWSFHKRLAVFLGSRHKFLGQIGLKFTSHFEILWMQQWQHY